jgi:hypothetical protein
MEPITSSWRHHREKQVATFVADAEEADAVLSVEERYVLEIAEEAVLK